MQSSYLAAKSKVEQLELGMKMKEEAWSAIQESWKRQEEGWKSKEEAWKMMEAMWKSNSSKTEMQAVLPPLVLDALVQTDSVTRKNEFCQTVQSDGVDFQVQVSMQSERKIVSTQTIKEEHIEIALPNRPSSSSSKESKKRKLSSIQTASCNENGGPSINNLSAMPSQQRQEQTAEIGKVDDSILNSEVYKIYCQYEDPENAKEKIREIKHCCYFYGEHLSYNERKLKHALDAIWSSVPPEPKQLEGNIKSYNSLVNTWKKIEEVKIPINGEGRRKNATIGELFMSSLTEIKLIHPDGYEVLLVKDFEKGPGISKWYRGYAYTMDGARNIAKMNARGVIIPATDKISRTILWRTFAEDSMEYKSSGLVCQVIINCFEKDK